jgi:hypothetical protein
MNLSKRDKITVAIVCIVAIMEIFFYVRAYIANDNLQFSGVVQKVEYDIKGDATITINGSVYQLIWNNWSFGGQIQKGDSLVKVKNTLKIKLVKEKSKEVIFFE